MRHVRLMSTYLVALEHRQHTSAYVSIRQRLHRKYLVALEHRHLLIRREVGPHRLHTLAYVSIRQHTSPVRLSSIVNSASVVTYTTAPPAPPAPPLKSARMLTYAGVC
jgi:hypothetical protein